MSILQFFCHLKIYTIFFFFFFFWVFSYWNGVWGPMSICLLYPQIWYGLHGVVANILDTDIVVNEFEFQSCC